MIEPTLSLRTTEQTAKGNERGRRVVVWLLGALVLVLLAGLVAQQLFLWSVVPGPERAIEALVLLALSSVILLLFVIVAFVLVRNLIKLRRERREGRFGSRLKTRLVTYFIALSLLPITAMALFSYTFLNRSLEKWFGGFPEDIVVRAKAAQEADARRARDELQQAAEIAAGFVRNDSATVAPPVGTRIVARSGAPVPDPILPPDFLSDLTERYDLAALLVTSADGNVLDRRGIGDSLFGESLRQHMTSADPPATLTLFGLSYDAARVPVGDGARFVTVARERHPNEHLTGIVLASERFEQLRLSQRWVRGLGLTTLALLTLLVLFALTWTANHLARSIVAPLRELAEAADEVARGNLAHRVSEIADEELAQLATSFNSMTSELEESRRRVESAAGELSFKNGELEERRAYIEVVLASLSTGVISLDEHDRVTTANRAARSMLRVAPAPEQGEGAAEARDAAAPGDEIALPCDLLDLACAEDAAALERVVRRARRAGRATEQTSLVRAHRSPHEPHVVADGTAPDAEPQHEPAVVLPVALTATALQASDEEFPGERCGVVIVMEDLSELLAAQRAAAWSEVARRMAHEIKNPLTPIQLSAERIARQFRRAFGADGDPALVSSAATDAGEDVPLESPHASPVLAAEDRRLRRVVEEGTETITREVTSLKSMVDEFARFAQLPGAQLAPGDLNQIVERAIRLYDERLADLRLDVRLARELPAALVDAEQMRRVFVNLLENATEAVSGTNGEPRITIATGYDARRGVLLAEVADNGHGIRPSDYPRLFQPHFSTRNRGTGLGLAIVHRIITDHGGRITVEPNFPRGARFRLELPAAEERMRDEGKGMREESEHDDGRERLSASPSSLVPHPSSL